MRRLVHILLVIALSFSIGVHHAVLQSAAWVNMMVTYTQESDFADAVVRTFDGQHPCGLCKQIQHDQSNKSQQARRAVMRKLELFCETYPVGTVPQWSSCEYTTFSEGAFSRAEEPALRPPRVA